MTSNLSRKWIGSHFNNLFGRNTTHLRNDSSKSIVAVISSDQGSISQFSASKEGVITVNFKDKKDQKISKGLIPPGKLMAFERGKATDHLTILVKESDGTMTETASDVIIRANNSFRVDEDGIPHFLNYGEV